MDDHAAAFALESSASEQSEIDSLLVKLTTGALGFTVALGVLDDRSPWLKWAAGLFLLAILAVLVSKFMAVEALRDYYASRTHKVSETRALHKSRAERLDRRVKGTNYAAGGLFFVGAGSMVIHMLTS
jgi:hypothetical protein